MEDFIDMKEFTLFDQAGYQYDFKENENGDFDAWVGKLDNRRIIRTVSREQLISDVGLGLLLNKVMPCKSLSEWLGQSKEDEK